jgi:hypothetical protein
VTGSVRAPSWLVLLVTFVMLHAPTWGATDPGGPLSYRGYDWQRLFDRSRDEPRLRRALLDLDKAAGALLQRDPAELTRPVHVGEILPSQLDARANGLGPNREKFALALADSAQSDLLRRDGVIMALAARYTGNEAYLRRALEMLVRFAWHSPMQRPGWSLTSASATMPEAGDGVWLATGWGMSGIVDMLVILEDRVPVQIRDSLRKLLRDEVERVRLDWINAVPWYVRSADVTTNQWIEPSIGLVKACMYLGDPQLGEAYELGVRNLLSTAHALGDSGSFPEGVTYANMTCGSLCDIAEDLRRSGDDRLAEAPFVRNLWNWLLQAHVSGTCLMNFSDSRMSRLPDYARSVPLPALMQAAMASSDPLAVPSIRGLFPDVDGTSIGLRWALRCLDTRPIDPASLPRWAHFGSGRQVVWRSRWSRPQEAAVGWAIWMKGGSLHDGHAHRDQGQVSVYVAGVGVLLDCGTPDYSDPGMQKEFVSAGGHGIMQLREVRPGGEPVDAPLEVIRLDEAGGQVRIDATRAYRDVKSCVRQVTWDSRGLIEIRDAVSLSMDPEAGEFFRFHLGGDRPQISGSGRSWRVSNGLATMDIEADVPVSVDVTPWRDEVQPPSSHHAIRISAISPTQSMDLRTSVHLSRVP